MIEIHDSMFAYAAENESETHQLGSALAEVLLPGTTIGLIGTLGAGKTRLVQAVAEQLGVRSGQVTSPTFVLLHQYMQGKNQRDQECMPIYHFDAYRLRDEDEFLELGPEEYFDSNGITFIEWAERVSLCLPPERIEIRIDILSETGRQFTLSATTDKLEALLLQLEEKLMDAG